jgi:hypothetical protein
VYSSTIAIRTRVRTHTWTYLLECTYERRTYRGTRVPWVRRRTTAVLIIMKQIGALFACTCPQTQAPDPARCVSDHAPRTHQAEPARGQHLKSAMGHCGSGVRSLTTRAVHDGARNVMVFAMCARVVMLSGFTFWNDEHQRSARAHNWLTDWHCVPWFHA